MSLWIIFHVFAPLEHTRISNNITVDLQYMSLNIYTHMSVCAQWRPILNSYSLQQHNWKVSEDAGYYIVPLGIDESIQTHSAW